MRKAARTTGNETLLTVLEGVSGRTMRARIWRGMVDDEAAGPDPRRIDAATAATESSPALDARPGRPGLAPLHAPPCRSARGTCKPSGVAHDRPEVFGHPEESAQHERFGPAGPLRCHHDADRGRLRRHRHGTGRTSKDGFTQAPQKDGALTVRGGTSTPPSRHRTTVRHLAEGPLRTVTAPTEVPVVPDRRDDNHGAARVHELPTDGAGSRIHTLTARPLTASRTAVRAAWTVLRARRCLVPCSCHCRRRGRRGSSSQPFRRSARAARSCRPLRRTRMRRPAPRRCVVVSSGTSAVDAIRPPAPARPTAAPGPRRGASTREDMPALFDSPGGDPLRRDGARRAPWSVCRALPPP